VKRYLVLLLVGLFMVGIASMAQAQATRTWVSGVGDDVNPCSRTAPCKTYAGAISKTAASGIISTLDPGGFGAVTIVKSIMIDGTGQIGGILASGNSGVVINAPLTTDVIVLRGLEIHGSNLTGLNGVDHISGGEVYVENCRIQNFNNDGVRTRPTANFVHKVSVRNSDIRNCLRGVEIASVAPATVQLFVGESNLSGTNGGSGVEVGGANNSAAVFNSSMTHNTVGLQVQQGSSTAYMEGCLVAYNVTGVNGGGEVRLSRNSIVGNTTNGLTGTTRGFQSNMIIGNGGSNTVTNSVASQ
jgi:hypothetical protein